MNSILSHRSLIKDLTQTAVIYRHCITMHFNTELDVSYASLFLKVIVTMFENYISSINRPRLSLSDLVAQSAE